MEPKPEQQRYLAPTVRQQVVHHLSFPFKSYWKLHGVSFTSLGHNLPGLNSNESVSSSSHRSGSTAEENNPRARQLSSGIPSREGARGGGRARGIGGRCPSAAASPLVRGVGHSGAGCAAVLLVNAIHAIS